MLLSTLLMDRYERDYLSKAIQANHDREDLNERILIAGIGLFGSVISVATLLILTLIFGG